MHGVALDVHAEDRLGLRGRLVGVAGELHAAGLAPAAGLHLGLDDDLRAEPRGDLPGFLGSGRDAARQDRHAMRGEQFLRLVLHQVHGCVLSSHSLQSTGT